MVLDALAKAVVALCEAPMTGPSETLPVLESRLAESLLAFDRLDEAWLLSHFLRVVARRGSK